MYCKILAAYTPQGNPQSLHYETTLNTVRSIQHEGRIEWEHGQWGGLETLPHNQVHLWYQNFDAHPVKPGRTYHNREFSDNCESLGLHPLLAVGCHLKPADGVLVLLMREHGIARSESEPIESGKPVKWWDLSNERRAQSPLSKWSCGCQNIRVGTREFCAQCLRSGNLSVRFDQQTANRSEHALYPAAHSAVDDTSKAVECG
jgi:hypothetical protein